VKQSFSDKPNTANKLKNAQNKPKDDFEALLEEENRKLQSEVDGDFMFKEDTDFTKPDRTEESNDNIDDVLNDLDLGFGGGKKSETSNNSNRAKKEELMKKKRAMLFSGGKDEDETPNLPNANANANVSMPKSLLDKSKRDELNKSANLNERTGQNQSQNNQGNQNNNFNQGKKVEDIRDNLNNNQNNN